MRKNCEQDVISAIRNILVSLMCYKFDVYILIQKKTLARDLSEND